MKFGILDNWSICDNEMGISLMNYFVSIKIVFEENIPLFKLSVFFDSKERLSFLFRSLEEAVTFTEDVINKDYLMTLDDINRIYDDEYRCKVQGLKKLVLYKKHN